MMRLRSFLLAGLWVTTTALGFTSAANRFDIHPEADTLHSSLVSARPVFQRVLHLSRYAAPVEVREGGDLKGRLRIGVPRDFVSPAVVNAQTTAAGDWTLMPDGSRVWAATITVEGAEGVRLHVRGVHLPEGATLLVYAPFRPGTSGVVDRTQLAGQTEIWMPSVLSSNLIFECRVPQGRNIEEASFTLDGISHLYDSPAPSLAKAGACENDVSCFDSWKSAANGVGRISFVENGSTYVCTGSLLAGNDASSPGPYFLTANHCVASQTVASTMEVYWLFQTPTCGAQPPLLSEVPRTAGGADFLAGAIPSDFALLRLRSSPPAGVFYLSWSAVEPPVGEAVATIHHPGGNYKRISFGALVSSDTGFNWVRWSSGVTEPGSSGAPLFNSNQQVVGQLYGGSSSCSNPSGSDTFGRFDVTYRTVSAWLEPGSAPVSPPPLTIPRGTYTGLFMNAGFSSGTAGAVVLTTAANRRFTGSVRMSSGVYAFTGMFSASGTSSVLAKRSGSTSIALELTIDRSDTDRISGSVSGVSWASDLFLNRSVFNGATRVAPQVGSYTLAMPDAGGGDGVALSSITRAGVVRFTGKLPGGGAWSRGGYVSKDGDFPLFQSGSSGAIAGWIAFGAGYWSSPGGTLNWVRPKGELSQLRVMGSRYSTPAPTAPVLTASDLLLSLSGSGINASFTLLPGQKRTATASSNAAKAAITFNSNGTFSGRAGGLVPGQIIPFSGVVLQNDNSGYGYFSAAGYRGNARLAAQNY